MGFDSRSAMVRGGLTDGFGDLTAALMLAPQLRRKNDDEEKDKADQIAIRASERASDEKFRRDQLAQALGIHNDELGVERDRIKAMSDANAAENQRKSVEDFGSGVNNAWRRGNETLKSLGSLMGKPPASAPVDKFDPMTREQHYDPESGKSITTYRPKTADEVDAELAARNRFNGRSLPPQPQKPADPIEVIAARRAQNQNVQEQQRAQGLMARPGDPALIPSTAGLPPPAPAQTTRPSVLYRGQAMGGPAAYPDQSIPPAQAPAPAPIVAALPGQGKKVRHAALADLVAKGQYPTMEAAAQHAQSLGYAIEP